MFSPAAWGLLFSTRAEWWWQLTMRACVRVGRDSYENGPNLG